MLTANKIPDNHINFWDEIFKAGDEVLNNLLKALNEHIYNNGIKVKSPVISFFSASNEIPNLIWRKSRYERYDRFDFKVRTKYLEDSANRMKVLHQKQQNKLPPAQAVISLEELYAIHSIKVPVFANLNGLLPWIERKTR